MSDIKKWKRVADYGQPPDGAICLGSDRYTWIWTNDGDQTASDHVLWFVPELPGVGEVAMSPALKMSFAETIESIQKLAKGISDA